MLKSSDYLKIRYSRVYNSKARKDIKIVALGDLHLSSKTPKDFFRGIIKAIIDEKPNYICLLGDFFDNPYESDKENVKKIFLDFLKDCSKIAPIIMVLGNHDYLNPKAPFETYYNESFWDYVASLDNVHLLNKNIYVDDKIYFMGYLQPRDYFYDNNNVRKMLDDLKENFDLYKNVSNELPSIALIHSPYYVKSKEIIELLKDYDLLLSGHTHNGCMPALLDGLVPGSRGIISPEKFFFAKYNRGISTLKTGSRLIVTGGIVKLSSCTPKLIQPLNALCNKQMDVITLTKKLKKDEIKINNKKIKL